jgi:chitodextrinase
VTISGFENEAGNKMVLDSSHSFTTEMEPLTPAVTPNRLTIYKNEPQTFSIAFGQGTAAASGAAITVKNHNIATVSEEQVVTPGAITVTGAAIGTTDITIAFNDTAHTVATVTITVLPKLPTWPADSKLEASGITSNGVTLTWTAAQDATAVTGYRIYQDGTLIATVNGSRTSYEVKGLSASTAYHFQVQAGNAENVWSTSGPDIHITTNGVASNNGSSSNTSYQNGSFDTKPDSDQTDSKPDALIIIGLDVQPVTDKNGNAAVTLSEMDIAKAIAKAREEAKTQGKTKVRIGITVHVELPDAAGSLKVTVSQQALKDLMDADVEQFTINGELLSISYNSEALKELMEKSKGDVTLSINRATELSKNVRKLIGTRPVYKVTLSYLKNGKPQKITGMSGGSITLTIPYKIRKNESAGNLYAIYVDNSGKTHSISGSKYDDKSGCVRFETKLIAIFGIGYQNSGTR